MTRMSSSTRPSHAWIVVSHITGAAAIGGFEVWRLGSARVALVLLPLFAAVGLVAGSTIALAERAVARPIQRGRWAIAALGIAAPSLAITWPVCATLFDGAYAQTLPMASVLPYLLPLVLWLLAAAGVAIGRRLAGGDLIARAIAIVGVAFAIGAVIWAKRMLGAGYADARIGAAVVVVVLAGIAVRLARRGRPSVYATAALASVVVGATVAAVTGGLALEEDRRLVATYGDHGRDLVRLWRGMIDLDGDGVSPILGGGDCDDGDPDRYPGALDVPGDGIDQDCDGEDAVAVVARRAPAPEAAVRVEWRSTPAPSLLLAKTRTMNVLLITVDALRYDMLAPDAPDRDDFPELVHFLDQSVFFTRAFSPGSGTDIALTTLLAGRLDPYQEIETTLGEAMRALGRHTANAMPSEVLRHVGEGILGRGFERVRKVYTDWEQQDIGDHISGADTTNETLKNIADAHGKPFFVWAHYFDVHEHHQIRPTRELLGSVHDGGSEHVHRYRAMLLAVDRAFGKLLAEVDKRGLRDNTIVVFASDHGESLKEDARLLDTHGRVAYGPLVRIPIAIRIPGVAPARRLDPVTIVDLVPTLLELLAAPTAMGRIDGWSLVPAMLDAPPELRPPRDRAIVIHEEHQWAVVEWPYQLLVKPADDLTELYDLERDPLVKDDLAARLPDVTRRLRARYAEAPRVRVDRTLDGRAWRERQALPPRHRARP